MTNRQSAQRNFSKDKPDPAAWTGIAGATAGHGCTIRQSGTRTFIAGLTADALIAPWVIKGAMDGDAVAAYFRNVLAPELAPRTVVICDNLATHRNKAAAQALREARYWFLYCRRVRPISTRLKWHLPSSRLI